MRRLTQGEFARLARGGSIEGAEDVERTVQILATQTKAAIKRVHKESVDQARGYLRNAFARSIGTPAGPTANSYMRCFETYVTWDGTAERAEKGVQRLVDFAPEGEIRGRADVIFVRQPDQIEARLLFTDELPMSRAAAELIALPALLAVEDEYGEGTVTSVEAWQLASGQRERVDAATAKAREGDVRAILAQ